MFKSLLLSLLVFLTSCLSEKPINPTFEEIPVGKPAANFKLMGHDGKEYQLSDFKGKIVVLEWTNFDCPFVKKHYDPSKANMQNLQKKYVAEDVIWFSIISSAKGKQGYLEVAEANEKKKEKNNNATALLLDHSGDVGRLYAAKTTPHMYIIDKEGLVAYKGAIDSIASSDISDIEKADNYVANVLDALIFGQKIMIDSTKAYGCSVKY